MAALVSDVALNHNAIYQGSGESLILAVVNGKSKLAFVELVPSREGKYYRVNSALVSRLDYLRNKRLLWGKAQSSQAVSGPPSAVSGPSSAANQPQVQSAVNATEVAPPPVDNEGLARDRAEIAAPETELQKLLVEWQALHALHTGLGKRGLSSRGRGGFKRSAKRSDVQAY